MMPSVAVLSEVGGEKDWGTSSKRLAGSHCTAVGSSFKKLHESI